MLLAGLILFGSFYNLANYPSLWWDEAIFSETAANLVQHGRYAFTEQSPGQLQDLDFRISVGPMVILPVAAAYKVFGVNVISGRLVAVAYLCLAFLMLFLAARRLWGAGAAILAVALVVVGTDVFHWGRSVLGDLPALGLFLCSMWLFLRSLDSGGYVQLFASGLFLGLAFNAKEFYALACLPALALLLTQHWRHKRLLLLSLTAYSAGAALPPLAYLIMKAVILGDLGAAVRHFLDQKKLLCHEFFTPFTIGRVYPESVLYILKHPLMWLGGLGAVWLWRREGLTPGAKFWVANFLLWTLVYLTAVWWHRFALPALFLASPVAAHFLLRLTARLVQGWPGRLRPWLAGGALAVFVLLFYPLPGLDFFQCIYNKGTDAPYRLAEFIHNRVPPGCLIETPEYELVFLDDDHRIHLMPSYFFVESTPERITLLNPRGRPYDFNQVGADVLILGTFGKSVFKQVYPPSQVNRHWRRIAQIDCYDIYLSRKSARKWRQLAAAVSSPGLTASLGAAQKTYAPLTPPDPFRH
jgi:hypothetical protein